MMFFSSSFKLSACALAASVLISACGGGTESTDKVPPTVAITAAAGASGTAVFTFTFSEDVGNSFVAEDIAVTGGTAGSLVKVDAKRYTLTVTSSNASAGTIAVSIAAAKFKDVALNDNTQVAEASYAFGMVADFDIVIPVVGPYSEGGTGTITTTPPTGGTGSALALLRSGGQAWALNVLTATVPFTATRKTLSARVYSPTAGIPMKIKIEAVGGGDTGEVAANETVVVGWQTLTWTFTNADITKTYNTIVLLPNIGTVDAAPGKTYYFDDIKLLPAPVVTIGTMVADFDIVIPVVGPYSEGGTGTITTTPPTGGTGSALALLRSGGQAWALNVLTATVPFTATRKTLSARVYSPTAGIPMKIKIEAVGGGDTGEVAANETVVVGWQTLTWTFTNADITKTYNTIVLLPNIGTVDAAPGKTYYFDDIKLLAAASGSGSTTAVEMGAGGAQTLTIATGDVKTGDGGNTMFVANEGIFAVNYEGSAESTAPYNLAAWPSAKTAAFTGLTGVSGGTIGYYQDDANLSNSSQKVDEGGWVAGTAVAPNGVPNFFRYFVLKAAVSASAYMGLYVNAPNNGTVSTSNFTKIKFKVWGPAPMFERVNFNPVLEMTLAGPKVAGCTTGSGGTEITQTFTANLKNGAGGAYTLLFAGFTVKGLCGTDTNTNAVANVRASLARVVINVPGTSFNFTNLDGGNYATGVNLGPIGFTNN